MTTYRVPTSVQKCAKRAFELHRSRSHPLDGVAGVDIAEKLASGDVDIDTLSKVHRFFAANRARYVAETQMLRDEKDGPVTRSWLLHGGEAAERWARKHYNEAVEEGTIEEDPLVALFKKTPEEVYTAFQAGAWRYEYELDPNKAARFVEQYTRATGLPLELTKAFGESAKTVGQALYRRMHTADPFVTATKALKEPALRTAAMEDLKTLGGNRDYKSIEESLAKTTWTAMSAMAAAKLVWPPFVAYLILAVEAPEIIKPLNKSSLRPPQSSLTKPKPFLKYHDAINTLNTYFNFDGDRYVDPDDTPYEFIEDDMYEIMRRAWKGQVLQKAKVRQTLKKAYKWLKQNKLATGLFNIALASWTTKNWSKLLDLIPQDHDVYPYFKQFAGDDQPTADAPKDDDSGKPEPEVQGAGADKKKDDLEKAADEFTKQLGADQWTHIGATGTELAKALDDSGYDFKKGFHLWNTETGEMITYTGSTAYDKKANVYFHAFKDSNGKVVLRGDQGLAHDYLAGTYAAEAPIDTIKAAPDDAVSTPTMDTDDEEADADTGETLAGFMQDEFDDFGKLKYIPWGQTETYTQIESMYDVQVNEGSLLVNVKTEDYFETLKAFKVKTFEDVSNPTSVTDSDGIEYDPGEVLLFFKDDEGALLHQTDKDIRDAVLVGNVKPVTEEDLEDIEDLRDQPFSADWKEYLDDWISNYESYGEDWEQIDLSQTTFFTAALNNGGTGKQGEVWVKKSEYHPDAPVKYILEGAAKGDYGKIAIFFTQKKPSIKSETWSEDSIATKQVENGTFMPLEKWEKFHAQPDYEPAHQPGTLLTDGTNYYWIVGSFKTGDQNTAMYSRVELYIELGSTPTPHWAKAEDVDSLSSMKVVQYNATLLQVYDKLNVFDAGYKQAELPDELSVSVGEFIESTAIGKAQVVGFMAADTGVMADGLLVVGKHEEDPTTGEVYPRFWTTKVLPYISVPETSYDPPKVDSPVDFGDMCGTQEAIDWVTGPDVKGKPKGDLELTTKNKSPGEFNFDLGQKREHDNGKWTVTIIGFMILPAKGTFPPKHAYVLQRENGKIGWKTAKKMHLDYDTYLQTEQDVVDAVKPLPGAPAPEFPALNYALGTTAKDIAQKHGILYQPADEDAIYDVGTTLVQVATGSKVRLVGWTKHVPSDPDDAPKAAVLAHEGYSKSGKWMKIPPVTFTKENFTIEYKHSTELKLTGEATFGKAPDAPAIGISAADLKIPSDTVPGFDTPSPIKQPPFEKLPTGKHVSAGVVAIIPADVKVIESSQSVTPSNPLVVMFHPFNNFAGYSLTYPKGTVDKGEGLTKAAVREFFEETGMSVKPTAYLGDFKGKNSVTRFFMGVVTGGNPKNAGPECDAVTLKPLPVFGVPKDHYKGQKWYQSLEPRDKDVTDAAVEWMLEHGAIPQQLIPEYATEDVQPTAKSDSVSIGAQAPKAKTTDQIIPVGKWGPNSKLASKLGFKKLGPHELSLGSSMNALGFSSWAYQSEKLLVQKGYPSVGSFVKVTGGHVVSHDETWEVLGYVVGAESDGQLGYAQLRIILYSHEGTNLNTVKIIQITEEGEIIGTGAMQSDFVIMSRPETATPEPSSVPAKDEEADFWHDFVLSSKVPIGPALLEKIQAKVKDKDESLNVPPVSWKTLSTYTPESVAYGDTIRYPAAKIEGTYLGRVRWDGTNLHFVYWHDGVTKPDYAVVRDDIFVAGAYKVDPPDGNKYIKPWYEHPDSTIQSVIENVAKKKSTKYAKIGTFKKYFKQAGVPLTSYMKKDDLLSFATLFLPGIPKAVRDSLLHGLKYRADLKKKGKKPSSLPTDSLSTTPGPVVAKEPKLSIEGSKYTAYLDNPDPSLFTDTGKGVSGGSKPNKLLDGPEGAKWFWKTGTGPSEAFRAHIDKAAYKLSSLVKDGNVPVTVMEFDGKTGSLQPFAEDANPVPSNPLDLDQDEMAEVLTQHVVDMFMGDHDGHAGNWLKIGNKLRRIDLGQAFKFMFQKTPDSFDPSWQAPGNFGTGYAKKLLVEWGKGEIELESKVFFSMKIAIGKIQGIGDGQLKEILAPVFESKGSSQKEQNRILKELKKRRDNYLDDWESVLTGLRSDFKWPGGAVSTAGAFKSSPEEMKFGIEEADGIDKVTKLPEWLGRTLRIDAGFIENQQVMVQQVTSVLDGPAKKATLIRFRVNHEGGKRLVQNVGSKVTTVTSESKVKHGGPQPLVSDVFWHNIEAAIKTLNYHLHDQNDLKVNQTTLNAAFAMKTQIKALQSEALGKDGFHTNGDPYEEIASMASLYIDYLDIIQGVADNLDANLGKKTQYLNEFLYDPKKWEDKKEKEEPKVAESVTVEFAKSGGKFPNIVAYNSELATEKYGLDAPLGSMILVGLGKQLLVSGQPQFIIRDKGTGAMLFINPPAGASSASAGGFQMGYNEGSKGYQGISWGYFPGTPSPGSVAHLLKLAEYALGIEMKPAKKIDQQISFLAANANALQKGGKFTPTTHHHSVVESKLQDALNKYYAGNSEEALEDLKKIVASKLKIGKAEIENYLESGKLRMYDDTEGGWERPVRLGETRESIIAALGKDVYPAHRIMCGTMGSFIADVGANGAVIAQNEKYFRGAPVGKTVGESPSSDVSHGGSQGVFGVFRRLKKAGTPVLYFDPSLLLRLDVYMVGNKGYTSMSDAYGEVEAHHIKSVSGMAEWVKSNHSHLSAGISPGSPGQINYRHEVKLTEYLYLAHCSSKAERDKCIEICNQRGWTKFAQGRSPEQVFSV